MIHIKKLRRNKFHTAITSIADDSQKLAVATWTRAFPNVSVIGPIAPIQGDGMRHFPTNKPVSLRSAFGVYLGSIPGNEICMFAEPTFTVEGDASLILNHVESERIEMTWGCFVSFDGHPRVFLCTTSVVAHMMMSLGETIHFGSGWEPFIHGWMQNAVRHRYFDATKYGIFKPVDAPKPVEEPAPKPAAKKKKANG